jgi:hypothetical protein
MAAKKKKGLSGTGKKKGCGCKSNTAWTGKGLYPMKMM